MTRFIRTAHGNGASALARVETPPVDELPAGIRSEYGPSERSNRGPNGRFVKGNTAGRARRGQTRLSTALQLAKADDPGGMRKYIRAADAWRAAQADELARSVGGGYCGPGPTSILATAALALAASRFLFDQAVAEGGNPEKLTRAAKLGDSHRQALLTATALCAQEAETRPRSRTATDEALARIDAVILPDEDL